MAVARYSSKNSGAVVRSVTRPISFMRQPSGVVVPVERVDVEPVVELAHHARVRVVCLMA